MVEAIQDANPALKKIEKSIQSCGDAGAKSYKDVAR